MAGFGSSQLSRQSISRRSSGPWRLRLLAVFMAILAVAAIVSVFVSERARATWGWLADLSDPEIRLGTERTLFGPEIRLPFAVEDRNAVALTYRVDNDPQEIPIASPEVVHLTKGLDAGPHAVTIVAVDAALLSNRAELRVPVEIDQSRPTVTLKTDPIVWTKQGQLAHLRFVSSEEVETAADAPYSIIREPDGGYLLLRPVPIDEATGMKTDQYELYDRAGNVGVLTQRIQIKPVALRDGTVTLTDALLAKCGVSTFAEQETLREQNYAQITQICSVRSTPESFSARYQRPSIGEWTSLYGERRLYNKTSWHRHLAMDIAHLAGAEIVASGDGTVAYADVLGIYGNCIIIDHGWRIYSLYAHLASLEVAKGDTVKAGQRIASMGDTGLAGGVHLHYSILVANVYVSPDQFLQKMAELAAEKTQPAAENP
ncbi:MAG: M23 family metallopeptidase [Candidatus Schekmanbacteria bacterium]|nr:M23 family metallopeptidase [Candidatus Schekmanbacteria bacterium]